MTIDQPGGCGVAHPGTTDPSNSPSTEPSAMARLLRFEQNGDTFTFRSPTIAFDRLFGGLVAAQGLAAAAHTVDPAKAPQSLHAYFVRAGVPGVDLEFDVDRTRDGRAFDTRVVTARQNGRTILTMLASFHLAEPSDDWHPSGVGPSFDESKTPVEMSLLGDHFEARTSCDGNAEWVAPPVWIRARRPIEDDAVVRACTLTFVSDLGLMGVARPPGADNSVFTTAASLDHAVWFHRPFDPTTWHRYTARPLNHNDSRGLAIGAFHGVDGTLVANVSQEALWRR